MPSLLQAWALPAALLVTMNIAATWFNLVSSEVPEPYLDEFFHVPQAERYCKGDYTWDPKITTPPGLYLLTKVLDPLLGCDISSMRTLNAGALCIICPLSYGILRLFRSPTQTNSKDQKEKETKNTSEKQPPEDDQTVALDAHTAFNIVMFPPLFFFSALYYTDVVSTLIVLLNYSALIKKQTPSGTVFENVNTVYLGVMAVLCRQTNIFWVAVFPAGLAVADALATNNHNSEYTGARNMNAVLKNSWNDGMLYECSAQNAGLQDYIFFLLSLSVAAWRQPLITIKVALPYITLLGLFASFVVWNGGVVLGDKTAHTATIHIPQMLYIWPFIVFFSVPLLIGPLLRPIVPLLPKQLQTSCEDCFSTTLKAPLPSILTGVLFIAGGLASVHFNTIIHPYTLADNRHYVFYVFRILRKPPAIMYLAVPAYFLCAWLAIQGLGSSNIDKASSKKKSDASPAVGQETCKPCKISFVTIWLLTTTLSVVTAPLVEPRYFIIPWVIWRLHVPSIVVSTSTDHKTSKPSYDMRLVLETVWHFVINIFVAYMFLYKGFTWANEPGKVQRFLW